MRALFLFVLLGLLSPGMAHAQGNSRPAADQLVSSCEGCHGRDGRTQSATVPRLNGQTREYLTARLKDLRNPLNQTVNAIHVMLWPARGVRDSDIAALVEHFAGQAPSSPNGTGNARASGAALYARGDGTRIPSCAACHGDAGQGIGEAPRLAGQHGSYLVDQMEALMLTARLQPGMNKHAWGLMPEEIRSLAAFLAND